MEKFWDIAVIGGGAAGLAAAIEAKRTAKTLSVLLLEKNACPGRKLSVTGNGRCNLSNRGFLRNRASRYARRSEGCTHIMRTRAS